MNDEPKYLQIVKDVHGNLWGPFANANAAAKWAKAKWPEQKQITWSHKRGWDIVALREPD